MKEQIEALIQAMDRAAILKEDESADDFDRMAQEIAQIALQAFSGKLLRAALEIVAAIVDFADEFERG